jgi:hypothetical protein
MAATLRAIADAMSKTSPGSFLYSFKPKYLHWAFVPPE